MANEYRAKSFADAFRMARKDVGAGGQAVWIRPNGTRMTFNTNLKEEIPVNQYVYSPLLSSEDERLAEKRYKEARESAKNAFLIDRGIELVKNNGRLPLLDVQRNGEALPKSYPTLVTRKNSGNIEVPYYEEGFSRHQTYMPEITVVAQRINHKMRKNVETGKMESVQENFLPVDTDYKLAEGNSVHYNYITGEYEMIDKKGEILATSADGSVLRDPSRWTGFHSGRNGDIQQSKQTFEQQKAANHAADMRLAEENRTINAPLHILTDKDGNVVVDKNGKPIYNGKLTTGQVIDGMNYGKQIAVDAFQNLADMPNHAILGGLKLMFDPNYTTDKFKNGIFASKDHIGGLGDFFAVEEPKSRFALNLINPTSVFSLGATTKMKLPQMTAVTTKGAPIRIAVPNDPASMYRRASGAHEGMGTITRNVGRGGSQSWTQYGGKHVAGTGSHTEVLPTQTTTLQYTPGYLKSRPFTTMTYDMLPERRFDTKPIIDPISVEYENGPEQAGYQYERMLGNPDEVNSSAVEDKERPGNVTINGSNDKANKGRSNGRRLLKRTKARKSRQETGNIDISN